MTDFVHSSSIVRRIWGNSDTVLLVFAGSAAEFALNRAVDWLFFTGKLPNDPIGRLFATAAYSQQIVFADTTTAAATLHRIRSIHEAVERARGARIPEEAHRDVLYMLIDYSEKAYEMLARPLTIDEKRELYDVFHRVGSGLGIAELPPTYEAWRDDRDLHLRRDLVCSEGTRELYTQYRKHLGHFRYELLLRVQSILVPAHVRTLLGMARSSWLQPVVRLYPVCAALKLRAFIQKLLLPAAILPAVRALEHQPAVHPPKRAGDGALATRCPFARMSAAVQRVTRAQS